MKYDIYIDKVFQLCSQGKFDQAEEQVNYILQTYGWIERAIHLKLCIYSIMNKKDKAKDFIQRIMENNIWINPIELESDTDVDNLRDLDEFQNLLEFSWRKFNEFSKNSKRKVYELNSNINDDVSIFFVHGRGTNFSEFKSVFGLNSVFYKKRLFYIQSGQVYAKNKYCWDDEEIALNQIEDVLRGYQTNKKIICGISQGGRILVNALIKEKIKEDLLLIMPAVSSSEVEQSKNLSVKQQGNIKIIVGDKDNCYQSVIDLAMNLKNVGYSIDVRVIQGMGHYITKELESILQEVLQH
ncbi:MAG: hypothetical protein ACI398_07225 [Clostridium sp.]